MENQRNITVQIPLASSRTFIPVLFGAAALFFFFTFCEVSCGNQRLAAMTGVELITGTTIKGGDMFGKEFEEMLKTKAGDLGKDEFSDDQETETDAPPKTDDTPGNKEIPPNPWAILALAAAFTGLGIYIFRSRFDALVGGIAGIVGGISLLIMQVTMSNAVKDAGGGFAMIEVNFTLAFWGALLALLIAGVMSFMRMRLQEEVPPPPPLDFSGPAQNTTSEDDQA